MSGGKNIGAHFFMRPESNKNKQYNKKANELRFTDQLPKGDLPGAEIV
jgi:hypothetical protein